MLSALSIQSRAQAPHFNHNAIFVVDLQKSADFYEKVMMFDKIAEPFHDNKHIWFKIGEHNQLHVIQGAKEIIPHDINIHMAFSVPSLEKFIQHLEEKHIKYSNSAQNSTKPTARPDGVTQIYLQDPDGYWIEINDDKY